MTILLTIRPYMLYRIALLLSLAVCTMLTFSPRASAETSEQVQVMCPVLPDEKVDPNISVEYEGRTVYLCCQRCKRLFETSPEKYADAIVLVSASEAGEVTTDAQDGGHDDEAGHDEAHHDESLLHEIGEMHPIAVHFPIALLITAALARCLVMIGALPWAESAVRFCVWIGASGAIVAALLGWFDAGAPDEAEAFGDLIFNHRWLGIATAVLSVVLLVLIEKEARKAPAKPTGLTTLALIGVAVLVGFTGHYGGLMTHGNYLPW